MYFAEKEAVFAKALFSEIFVSLETLSYGMDGIPSAGTIVFVSLWQGDHQGDLTRCLRRSSQRKERSLNCELRRSCLKGT
jgi:hypothetical protein